ncbi:T9SS-dependent M36 family metallopeptidase [Xanthomarina sp. F2636L]|uniref:T9SS-dependent M36 family metallopeptidase n=1 Tax=Xanthomarina sp. F2636L TaxID=2996018 RepID=UPI00225E6C5C|nr:T9SS-dependent M36 family metallopeptidase [Xanthomarina sp. F2636L]MCX7551577.1 T9SS-dependent M36 family metallopeptidase [Xanthomarina sp. F2636L]
MRNNYFQKLLLVGMLLFGFVGFAQHNLTNSEYNNVIKNYLNLNQAKYHLTANDIQDLYVNNEYFSKSTKINHVYINQRFQGIEIYNAISSVAIKDDAVFYYANSLISNISEKINTITPQINAQRAIENAVSQLNLGTIQGLELLSEKDKVYLYNTGGVSQVNIPVKLVYTLTEQGELKLSWDLSIHTLNGKNWWSLRVDAVTGNIIDTNDWVVSCSFGDGDHSNHDFHANVKDDFSLFKTNSFLADGSQYNVFAFPVEAPSFGGRTLLSSPADDNASPYGWHDINGAAGAEYTITRGNNVHAYEDTSATDTPGDSPDGTASLNFDFPLNISQDPSGYQDVSLTNLFYVNNIMHDIWYQYGFDEASGNFQENNYGSGGLGSDYVNAQGQDGGGTDNANFGTPPDGQNPQMQMYLWSIPGGIQNLVTVNNSTVAGAYPAVNPATTPPNNITGIGSTPVTADLVLVDDGTALPNEGCNPISSVAGKIAVVIRGTCPFVDKIQNAQDAGAVAVIVVNHNNPDGDPAYVPYVNMAGEVDPLFIIPSVFMNYENGQILISAMQTQTLNVTLQGPDAFMLDGSFDNGIVAHEYGHGISNRLAGGPAAAGCLSNPEQMGEGWSDWFGLMLTMKPGDQPEDARGIGTYAIGQPTNGLGIRLAPYSTDFAINDYTYIDTNDSANVAAPHGIGFIWGTILWDLTWAYVDKYGFDTDLYNGTGGNNKVMQLVLDGLKLQNCSPGFVAGRDGLLAADLALTGGEDQCLIWEVFANRGVGLNASQGLGFTRTDQVEDFTMPPSDDPSLANCTSLSVSEFNSNNYKVYPNPTNGSLFIKTAKNYGQVTLTITDINGRQVLSEKAELFNQVELNINKLQTGIYILNIHGESFSANHKIIKN